MEDNLRNVSQDIINSLSNIVPNIKALANIIDRKIRDDIEIMQKTDPEKAEKMASEYAKVMNEGKVDEKINELNKSFEAFRK